MDCLFCKIVAGDIPATKVYETDDVLAFLDIRPGNPGHTLVIPKKHAEAIFDISAQDWGAVSEAVRILAIAIEKATGAQGINLKMNNREHAGQEVGHAHVHIVPRFKGDGVIMPILQKRGYEPGQAEAVQQKIKAAL